MSFNIDSKRISNRSIEKDAETQANSPEDTLKMSSISKKEKDIGPDSFKIIING
jgi:hypothetical protein